MGKQISLEAAVKYPTPTASMITAADMEQARYAGNKGSNRPNYQEAKARTKFATPTALDWKDSPGMALIGTNPDGSERSKLDRLAAQIYSEQEDVGGSLNPTWVEWLMGWPIGWTDCAASATDRFRQWLDSHGVS